MKYYIKQTFLKFFGEEFYVYDENEAPVFIIRGSFFQFPKEFTIYSKDDVAIASITRHFLTFLPRYTIKTEFEEIELRKGFTFFIDRYMISGRNWELEGDFLSHEYRVILGDHPIMSITKHWFTLGDSYELTIDNAEDAPLCLGIVIAIDDALSQSNAAASAAA